MKIGDKVEGTVVEITPNNTGLVPGVRQVARIEIMGHSVYVAAPEEPKDEAAQTEQPELAVEQAPVLEPPKAEPPKLEYLNRQYERMTDSDNGHNFPIVDPTVLPDVLKRLADNYFAAFDKV